MKEFDQYDGVGLADLVRRGEVTPLELVDTAIARIEERNPKINAVIATMYDQARVAAQGEIPPGPFAGVPFLVKDLLAAVKGFPLTGASRFMKDFVPDQDSELVQRHRLAGLIILGKTNTPEFGIQPTTEPLLFGPSRNPWDLNRTTGGSSGGSAAAVAARMVPMAHGNDGGGSIRIPASCCGLFGLKPTRARNSMAPYFGDILSGLVAEHALTRSVRDSAALLDATAGYVTGDPYSAPPPPRPYLKEVGTPPGKLRIAFTAQTVLQGKVEPDCLQALQNTVRLLEGLGHQVEEATLDLASDELVPAFLTAWTIGVASAVENSKALLGRMPKEDDLEPLTRTLWEQGRLHLGVSYLQAIGAFQSNTRRVAQQFETYDLWLTPTLAKPPLPLGSLNFNPDDPMGGFMAGANFSPFTALCNVTGQPAMSVPLFWNEAGLPIGSHLIGRYGDEGTLFRLAAQLEEASPWKDRIPPGF